ncbi:GNAT family N-acetyltransferase [Vibrio sp.]|nr:GNAT family N-acetyltransferase [Vibrio sp.]
MEILTERLTMSQLSLNDWELFELLNKHPDVIDLCFDEPTDLEIKDRFKSRLPAWKNTSEHWLCLTITELKTNKKIGVTGFQLNNGTAEVGYLFLPQYHGVGFGTESLITLLKWANEVEKIKSFKAVVTEGNIGSEKVLLKSGFQLQEIVKDAYEIGGRQFADHIYILNTR